jgi:hypothetical protein
MPIGCLFVGVADFQDVGFFEGVAEYLKSNRHACMEKAEQNTQSAVTRAFRSNRNNPPVWAGLCRPYGKSIARAE